MTDSFLTPRQAAELARRAGLRLAPSTVRRWCARYSIGRRVGGRLRVDAALFEQMLAGVPAGGVDGAAPDRP